MSRSNVLFANLLGLSLVAVGCDAGPTDPGDTDVSTDTDVADTDAVDTDVADTDAVDTDAADTDVVDTDVVDTDPPCPDADADGVCDADDLCAGEDSFGDLDADGLCDNTDLCSGDNATGDDDADGICGDLDACFGSDLSGDSDADGTCDDLDTCFGADPNDSDFDGVCDDEDLCNGQDVTGDSDGDYVCDDQDVCPLGDDNVDTDSSGYPDACEPVELGRVHIQGGGYGTTLGVYSYAGFTIETAAGCASATQGPTALGQTLAMSDGTVGTYSFDADYGYDFTALAACLTDGTEQIQQFWSGFSDGPNQFHPTVGGGHTESSFGGDPDFAGHEIVRIDLVVHSVTVGPDGSGGTQGTSDVEWVFYGYALP